MILNIYAVRDSAVEAFLQPFFSPTDGAAIRSLTEAVNDPKHPFATGPQYYALYHLGSFDDSNGVLSPLESGGPRFLLDCIQVVIKGVG
jgi:hypothetical protein